jgi:hypothetical protein
MPTFRELNQARTTILIAVLAVGYSCASSTFPKEFQHPNQARTTPLVGH